MPRERRPATGMGVRFQVLALAVAPLLLITLLLGWYVVETRLADARAALNERGRIIAENLGMAAEFALLTRDAAQMRAACNGVRRQPDVDGAAILDERGRVLAHCGSNGPLSVDASANLFRAPIGQGRVTVSDYGAEQQAASLDGEPIPRGWAVVHISLAATLERQRQILTATLLIIGGGLLVSAVAAIRIGNRFSRPLVELSAAMARYRAGDPDAGVRVDAGGEIGELQAGFNRMARSLNRSQSDLQNRVQAATKELRHSVEALSVKNAELAAAREEALAAGREKQEFLARMSHEMRTPLNAVIGFSRLLREDPSSASTEEYVRTINGAATQLLSVIDDILSYTRIESDAVELETIPFDPCACVEDVVVMLSPTAQEKGLELAVMVHRDVPPALSGDPNRISQILMNLVNNAIKFTAVGHVLVEVEYLRDVDGGVLHVVVADTGIGLSAEDRETLFRPFIQADSTVTRRFGGTGLGLAISKRLAELMGGELSVESEPGCGSRFHLRLPSAVETEMPATEDKSLAGRKVLVYDAHPVQLRALRATLLGWYMNVYHAGDAAALPKMLDTARETGRPFEVLVIGLGAREREPERLLRVLEDLRGHYGGPILLLSGLEAGDPSAALEGMGLVEWTRKPARRAHLYLRLRRLLGLEGSAAAGTGPAAGASLFGLRILVVEDNAFNRLLLRRSLERHGVQVTEAEDGPSAVAAVSRADFDQILMDIHMPGMDGIETTRRIRAVWAGRSHVPIIAVSADVFARERLPAGEPLFDELLLKPVAPESLEAAIRRWAVPPPGRQLEAQPGSPEPYPRSTSGTGVDTGARPGLEGVPDDLRDALSQENERLLRALQQAAAQDDRREMGELVHQLKGLCGVFQVQGLQRPVRELEEALEQAPAAALRERVRALRALVCEGGEGAGAQGED